MKTMMLTGIRKMELVNTPDPILINDTDVLIEMKIVGVCGSDLHYYSQGKIGSQVIQFPFPLGHEGSGIVKKTGKNVSHIKIGDRIAIEPAMPCFNCEQCKAGRNHTCLNLKFLGCPGQANGCLSEYIVIPETSCIKIADEISLEEAALSEPLSIGLYSVIQAGDIKGKDIGILGFGPIGMSVLLSASNEKTGKIIVTDKINDRLDRAKKMGVTLACNPDNENLTEQLKQFIPTLLDVVFECCGQQDAMNDALKILKPGGKLVLVGIPEFDYWNIPADVIRRKEITILNVRRQNHCAELAVELIGNKTIDIGKMATHRFPLSETNSAYELVSVYGDKVMKALIVI